MRVGTTPVLSTSLAQAMVELRSTFDDLTRQLSSGQVSQTHGGLGSGRSLSLAMHAKISQMEGFRSTIDAVDLRISTLSTTLTRLNKLASEQRSETDPAEMTI